MSNLTEKHFEILNALNNGWLSGRISELNGWDMAVFYQMHDSGLVSGIRMNTQHALICDNPKITRLGIKTLERRNHLMLLKNEIPPARFFALLGLIGLMSVIFWLMY